LILKQEKRICKNCGDELPKTSLRRMFCKDKCRIHFHNKINDTSRPKKHNWKLRKSLLNESAIATRKFTTPWDVYWHSGTLREMEKLP
tara:strand:- start:1336 stop:1599 length:264 start_codon:yes stop_codon:yes gene_type:complete